MTRDAAERSAADARGAVTALRPPGGGPSSWGCGGRPAFQGGLQEPLGQLLLQLALARRLQALGLGAADQLVDELVVHPLRRLRLSDLDGPAAVTLSLVIDASSLIGSYTVRLAVPFEVTAPVRPRTW